MKKLLLVCLSVFLFGEYVMGQSTNMSDLDYYNKAAYTIKKKGDISSGQMYMDLAFSKGLGEPTAVAVIFIYQELDEAFNAKNVNYFYVPWSMCNGVLNYCKPTEEEKEKIYAARGVSKLNIAISKDIKDPLNYCYCIDDLEKGGEYGNAVIQEYKERTQKSQKRQKSPQGKRLKKDPNFKIE